MDYIVKKASSLTDDEKIALGIAGIPQEWPIEMYPYTDVVPDGYIQISDVDLAQLKLNNQAAYDAWLQSLRPVQQPPSPQSVSISSTPTFTSKTIGTKKLFARNIGIQQVLVQGSNTFTYTVSFPWVKFVGVEVINAEALDFVDFQVLDNAQGSYSGIPNQLLNQFGFSTNIAKDFYQRICSYDADIYGGMSFKMIYTSMSAKTIGINFMLNEVK